MARRRWRLTEPAYSGSYVSATSANVTLTTANPNDVIILDIAYNGPAIASISDTAGLTWHERAVAGSSGSQIYQYYAIAPNALSADSITVNFAGTAAYYAMDAFGIVGANTSSPFDTNASIPGTSKWRDGLGDHQQCRRLDICCLSFL